MLSSQPQEVGPESSPLIQALHWARCHLGIVLFASLALAALVAAPRGAEIAIPECRRETEADLAEGEDPLFV